MEEREEKYQLVSIEEMRELAKSKNYALDEQDLKFEEWSGTNLKCAPHIKWWEPNLLRDHLLLEECMSRDDIDWRHTTHAYDFRMIAYMRYLWYNPLVWVPIPDEFTNTKIIAGRVAEERYVNRDDDLERWTPIAYNFSDEMLRWFVEKMPKWDGSEWMDVLEANYVIPDICLWYYLTTDDSSLRISIMRGDAFDISLLQLFAPHAFLYNMRQIAESYGGGKAAEIVRLFRKDWKRIVALKLFDINKLTPEQVEKFRACLFEGMDYYLEQWESERPEDGEKTTEAEVSVCRYIDKDKLAETGIHTFEEFTKMLRQACEQDAKSLGEFLRKYYKLGYLDFHGEGKKKIYEHLKACFPGAIKYSYPNFTQYFD